MLRCWFWFSPFILNVLTVCVCVYVFRVASDEKIQRNVRWLAGFWCLTLLCMLSNSNYRCIVEVGLLKMVLPTKKWRFFKWTDIYIYMCVYVCVYNYLFQGNACRRVRVCLRQELWHETRNGCGASNIISHQLATNLLLNIDWYWFHFVFLCVIFYLLAFTLYVSVLKMYVWNFRF